LLIKMEFSTENVFLLSKMKCTLSWRNDAL
jgi:hypothetical protein